MRDWLKALYTIYNDAHVVIYYCQFSVIFATVTVTVIYIQNVWKQTCVWEPKQILPASVYNCGCGRTEEFQ